MSNNSDVETIYDRVVTLEDEIALLKSEMDVIKKASRNKIARYEISTIKKGDEIVSIID